MHWVPHHKLPISEPLQNNKVHGWDISKPVLFKSHLSHWGNTIPVLPGFEHSIFQSSSWFPIFHLNSWYRIPIRLVLQEERVTGGFKNQVMARIWFLIKNNNLEISASKERIIEIKKKQIRRKKIWPWDKRKEDNLRVVILESQIKSNPREHMG